MYKDLNVLVAGGTGTIGVPTVKILLERGAKVSVVSLDSKRQFERIFKKDSEKITFQNLDLTDLESCHAAVKNQDVVINLVGIKGNTGIGQTKVASFFIPMLRFQTNLMEAAYKNNVSRYLFTSSICAYPQGELHFEDSVWNGFPKQNDRIPGIAKRVGELLGEAFELEFGWDAVRTIRPANVYGPFDDFNPITAQVIPALIAKTINATESIEVWGDGKAVRDFVYSEDIAFWALEALEKGPPNFPLNFGSGDGFSIKALAELIISLINPKCEITWNKNAQTGDPIRLLSIDRARDTIGYKPKTSLSDGIIKTILWYKNELQNYK